MPDWIVPAYFWVYVIYSCALVDSWKNKYDVWASFIVSILWPVHLLYRSLRKYFKFLRG